ncbi:MAG: glycosyltransferase family 39 protein, partial [Acidobacteriota bacterium]|nr:glycosyltransferase family 39 protein [Acidobacteriota bacterium]
MTLTPLPLSPAAPRRSTALTLLLSLWGILFFASLFAPPLLDDADATHASAAHHILTSGDWTTLKVNGIRYLEKAPLPYWLVAICMRIFGANTFAAHLPQALAVLLLALLGFHWAGRAYGGRAAFYTGLATLTAAGIFLFTRIFIPEVLLSLLLAAALYCFLQAIDDSSPAESAARAALLLWAALALAVLTKGLVALVFFGGTALLYLVLTRSLARWRRLRPAVGLLVLLAIAAPWHILAGLRNTGGTLGGHTHGFFWFYFVNEHFLRFLGKRLPRDYNKLPASLYWVLHLVWLFPWSLFLPLPLLQLLRRRSHAATPSTGSSEYTRHTTLLLALFSVVVLVFFSFSTNQEYYTFPAYLPLLMLIAAALARAEAGFTTDAQARRWIHGAHATLTVAGLAIAITLLLGLWSSRNLPFVPDIGDLLAHRGVGDYTLSMSHLFDLTGPSFAALRLPASLAALAFLLGPAAAWWLRRRHHHLAATTAVALTAAIFLIAAHIALVRFGTMLSSANFASAIDQLQTSGAIEPDTVVMLYGDQSYGSSIVFYLNRE